MKPDTVRPQAAATLCSILAEGLLYKRGGRGRTSI
jgi:hypothetical protein